MRFSVSHFLGQRREYVGVLSTLFLDADKAVTEVVSSTLKLVVYGIHKKILTARTPIVIIYSLVSFLISSNRQQTVPTGTSFRYTAEY